MARTRDPLQRIPPLSVFLLCIDYYQRRNGGPLADRLELPRVHAYIHEYAILIPALLTLIRSASDSVVRFCALLLLLPVPYEISFYRLSGTVLALLSLVLMAAVTWDSRNRTRSAGWKVKLLK